MNTRRSIHSASARHCQGGRWLQRLGQLSQKAPETEQIRSEPVRHTLTASAWSAGSSAVFDSEFQSLTPPIEAEELASLEAGLLIEFMG